MKKKDTVEEKPKKKPAKKKRKTRSSAAVKKSDSAKTEKKKSEPKEAKKTKTASKKTRKTVTHDLPEVQHGDVAGDLVGKVYDVHDSPMGRVLMTKDSFAFLCLKTGDWVAGKDLRKLVQTDYLSATGGEKWLNIRWARTKKFSILSYASRWKDRKPHWSAAADSKS